jgi:Lipocalin-like domain
MILRILALGITLCIACVTGASAQNKSFKDALTGTWIIVSVFDQDEKGEKHNPWGNGIKGALMFDGKGRFAQIIIGERQAGLKSADPRKPDAPVLAYFGTYTVDETGTKVSVKLDQATNSIRNGASQSWTISGTGDKMTFVGSSRKNEKGTFSPHIDTIRAK